MNIDWKKDLGQYSCYKNLFKCSNLDDVANCLSVIPKELDTPVLRKIRKTVDEYGGETAYPGEDIDKIGKPIKLKHLVTGKPYSYASGKEKPEDVLRTVKGRIRWGINDSAFSMVGDCNQKIEKTRVTDDGITYKYVETGNILDREGKQACEVDPDAMMKMRNLGYELDDEQWDFKKMSSKIREESHKTWIEEKAWDLSDEELESIDIDKRLGFKED